VPSRQDNLPNTGVEAHACGTPVVAQPFEPHDLAAGIRWLLADPACRQALGHAARERAVQLWNPARVAGLFAEFDSLR
jgi:hypothetical protein